MKVANFVLNWSPMDVVSDIPARTEYMRSQKPTNHGRVQRWTPGLAAAWE